MHGIGQHLTGHWNGKSFPVSSSTGPSFSDFRNQNTNPERCNQRYFNQKTNARNRDFMIRDIVFGVRCVQHIKELVRDVIIRNVLSSITRGMRDVVIRRACQLTLCMGTFKAKVCRVSSLARSPPYRHSPSPSTPPPAPAGPPCP